MELNAVDLEADQVFTEPQDIVPGEEFYLEGDWHILEYSSDWRPWETLTVLHTEGGQSLVVRKGSLVQIR